MAGLAESGFSRCWVLLSMSLTAPVLSGRTHLAGVSVLHGASVSCVFARLDLEVVTKLPGLELSAGPFYGSDSSVSQCVLEIRMSVDIEDVASNTVIVGGFGGEMALNTVANSSIRSEISVSERTRLSNQSAISPFIGEGRSVTFEGVSVLGSLSISEENGGFVGLAFGNMSGNCSIKGMAFGVSVTGRSNILLVGYNASAALKTDSIHVDCSLPGVGTSEFCDPDIRTAASLTNLTAFSWDSSLNDQYPFPSVLPASDGTRYVLPLDGDFSAKWYFVDSKGLPFPVTDFQICRGVCFGEYESPAAFTCEEGVTDPLCIDNARAEAEFPSDSCIGANAVCMEGVSICQAEFELDITGQPVCVKKCPDCSNGFCKKGICQCDVYYTGSTCAQFSCGVDQPACSGCAAGFVLKKGMCSTERPDSLALALGIGAVVLAVFIIGAVAFVLAVRRSRRKAAPNSPDAV